MARPVRKPTSVEHPAPGRGRVSGAAMLLALLSAPIAMGVHSMFGMTVAGRACLPKDMPLAAPAFAGGPLAIGVVNAAALLVAGLAVILSIALWRRTRTEKEGREHAALDVGEGRTRFLAMCAIMTSGGFFVALVFATLPIVLVPLC